MYPSSLPNIDLQVLPTFPANVVATGAVDISKSGLSYTFGVNFQNVIEETNVSDMSKREVLVQDTDTGAFWRVKLTNLPTGQTDWSSIQNKPDEFPPSPHTHPAPFIVRVPSGDGAIVVEDEGDNPRAVIQWGRDNDEMFISTFDASAQLVASFQLGATGAAVNGDAVWTDGNKQIADGQVLANVSGSTGVPVGVTLSALLDKISNTRGAVLYRGASGWAALGAGAAGQVLTSGGAGADPSWQNTAAVAVDPWECFPIGVPIPVFGNIPGVSYPPTNKGYRYVNLTAGQTGPGSYNEGILTDETVSGSAPLVTATAVIALAASPMYGQTIHLIGTERRFIRAGASGAVQDDAMQGHRHPPLSGQFLTLNSGPNGGSGATVSGHSTTGDPVTDGANGTPRVANETRPRNIGATYFMRIL